jgi:hypothetical protein
MCGDCWNAAMGAPAAAVAARFAWIGYKDRIPFIGRKAKTDTRGLTPSVGEPASEERVPEPELVEVGSSSPP